MTSAYTATIRWAREGAAFTDNRYSRAHSWMFDGGITVPASSSPHVVRLPLSREDAVDPEEAFIASLSSCHMLFFLTFAAKDGIVIDSYVDEASGVMGKTENGKVFVSEVTLRPKLIISGGKRPTVAEIDRLHHKAHEECYIANSVTTAVMVKPPPPDFV